MSEVGFLAVVEGCLRAFIIFFTLLKMTLLPPFFICPNPTDFVLFSYTAGRNVVSQMRRANIVLWPLHPHLSHDLLTATNIDFATSGLGGGAS